MLDDEVMFLFVTFLFVFVLNNDQINQVGILLLYVEATIQPQAKLKRAKSL